MEEIPNMIKPDGTRALLAARFPCQDTGVFGLHHTSAHNLFWYGGIGSDSYGEQSELPAGWYCALCRQPGDIRWSMYDEISERNYHVHKLL